MKFPAFLRVIGDQNYRNKNCPMETLEQVTFVNRLRKQYPDTLGRLVVHIKNEGKRTSNQALKDAAEGMTPGASDILIPVSPAIVIEFKRRDHTLSSWQKGQIDYLKAAHDAGSFVFVALGADAAMEGIEEWLRTTRMTRNG